MTLAYIGLGSNLNEPRQQLLDALAEFADIPQTEFVCCSGFYRSRPLGPPGQPDYLNAVAALATDLSPITLLAAMQAIEQKHGRDRTVPRWGPRTLDLDLLVFDDLQMQTETLCLPHPQMSRRNFVLVPLAEIAPDAHIPGLGPLPALLAAVGTDGLHKLD